MNDDQLKTATEAAMRDAVAGGIGVLIAGQRIPPSEFFRDAQAEMERVKCAAHQFRTDSRFRRLVDATVAQAFAEHGRIDPQSPERDANEIATWATALLLAHIYEHDAELRATREERDDYRVLAENAFASATSPLVWSPPR